MALLGELEIINAHEENDKNNIATKSGLYSKYFINNKTRQDSSLNVNDSKIIINGSVSYLP